MWAARCTSDEADTFTRPVRISRRWRPTGPSLGSRVACAPLPRSTQRLDQARSLRRGACAVDSLKHDEPSTHG